MSNKRRLIIDRLHQIKKAANEIWQLSDKCLKGCDDCILNEQNSSFTCADIVILEDIKIPDR